MHSFELKDGDIRIASRVEQNEDGSKGRYFISRNSYANELEAIVEAQRINIEFEPVVVRVVWKCK